MTSSVCRNVLTSTAMGSSGIVSLFSTRSWAHFFESVPSPCCVGCAQAASNEYCCTTPACSYQVSKHSTEPAFERLKQGISFRICMHKRRALPVFARRPRTNDTTVIRHHLALSKPILNIRVWFSFRWQFRVRHCAQDKGAGRHVRQSFVALLFPIDSIFM